MTETTQPWYVSETAPGFLAAEQAVHAILSRKGENVVVLDLRGRSDVADFFVIADGQSEPQVEALAKSVRVELFDQGQKPLHIEGTDKHRWVLLDFVDVIVHLMKPEAREYYDLERLWNDAGRLDVPEDYFSLAHVAERHPDLPLVKRAKTAAETPVETEDS